MERDGGLKEKESEIRNAKQGKKEIDRSDRGRELN